MSRRNWQNRCWCGASISENAKHCGGCAIDLRDQNPPPPRSTEDNALKAAFRKVIGWDPLCDPDPRWKFHSHQWWSRRRALEGQGASE